MFFKFFTISVLFLFSFYSQAQDGDSIPLLGIEQGWTRTVVGSYRSTPDQDQLAFLQQVGKVLNDYTQKTGFEACGAIASNNEQFSIIVVSDNVPHGCAIHTTEVEDGFTFIQATIHSHPFQPILRIDRKAHAWSAEHGIRVQADTLRNDGRSGFSKIDIATNVDSWLVAGNKLHFYDTRTKRKLIYELQ